MQNITLELNQKVRATIVGKDVNGNEATIGMQANTYQSPWLVDCTKPDAANTKVWEIKGKQAGNAVVTFNATNSAGATLSESINVTVNPAPPATVLEVTLGTPSF